MEKQGRGMLTSLGDRLNISDFSYARRKEQDIPFFIGVSAKTVLCHF